MVPFQPNNLVLWRDSTITLFRSVKDQYYPVIWKILGLFSSPNSREIDPAWLLSSPNITACQIEAWFHSDLTCLPLWDWSMHLNTCGLMGSCRHESITKRTAPNRMEPNPCGIAVKMLLDEGRGIVKTFIPLPGEKPLWKIVIAINTLGSSATCYGPL